MTMNDEKDQVGSVSISVPVEWLDLSSDNIEKAEPVDMAALLKANVTEHTERQLIRGRVVAITPTDVLVDVGLKSEGMVPREEFTDGRGNVTVQVGEEVEVFLERMEDINGHVVLSKSKAIKRFAMTAPSRALSSTASRAAWPWTWASGRSCPAPSWTSSPCATSAPSKARRWSSRSSR
jgi:hypothetical protein